MSAHSLAELLAGKETAPVLSLDEASLGDTGAFGPSAYYYMARWLDSHEVTTSSPAASAPDTAARARLLYRMAFDRASGIARKEAGLALIGRLSSAGLWDELLSFSTEFTASIGAEWKAERPRLEALDALGRNAEVSDLVTRLGSVYPAEAAADADALAYFGAAANMRAGGKAWAKALRRLLLERPGSDWTARAYALAQAEPRVRALFPMEELHALAMRDAVWRKDYGLAYKEALLGPHASMGRASSQAMIADAGRAFLYSGQLKEGEGRFAALGWTARYYRARFARTLERWGEAEALFKKAAAEAPTRADADAARWYSADCAYRAALAAASALSDMVTKEFALTTVPDPKVAAREAALDELVTASGLWKDPASFSDLVNGLYRDALNERDWRLIEDMAKRLAPKLAYDVAARVEYTAARLYELGLVAGSDGETDPEARAAAAAVRFAAIADSRAAPLYYRALAAWRAGIEPTFILLDPSSPIAAPTAANEINETEKFVAGIASFGLGDIALAEAKSRRAALSDDALRRLGALFSSVGRPDCALRLELALSSRSSFEPRSSDYELIYPRPYLDEIRSLKLESRIPERLALGLVRSESIFRVDAVSLAGAIGLSQLMPATAADQAKALGLSSYDLKTPKDNLAIGFAHFASLLQRTDGRPLRAMMAYNAGWGRLKTWVAESGELPDDLMIEALGIEETRQYCRNILQATVMYGELYYGRTVVETVGELVEGDKGDSAKE
jgi:soluble lytic murein transglycosylase